MAGIAIIWTDFEGSNGNDGYMHRLSRHSPAITAISCLMAMVWIPAAQGINAAKAPEAVTWIGRLLAIPAATFHVSVKRRGAGAVCTAASRNSIRFIPHALSLWAVASVHVRYAWQHGCPLRTIKTGIKIPRHCNILPLVAASGPRSPQSGFLRVLAARPPPSIL